MPNYTFSAGFFDGAAHEQKGGCGFRLWLNDTHSYRCWMAIDNCTNNFSELVVAWALLHWVKLLNIWDIRIFGDSRVVIDQLAGKADLHSINLLHWCSQIKNILHFFTHTSFCHVYREHNRDADILSKKGIGGTPGVMFYEELMGLNVISAGSITLYQYLLVGYIMF